MVGSYLRREFATILINIELQIDRTYGPKDFDSLTLKPFLRF